VYLATELLRNGKPEDLPEARKLMEEALWAWNRNTMAHNNLGVLLEAQGLYDEVRIPKMSDFLLMRRVHACSLARGLYCGADFRGCWQAREAYAIGVEAANFACYMLVGCANTGALMFANLARALRRSRDLASAGLSLRSSPPVCV